MAFRGQEIVLSADQFWKNLMKKPQKRHFFLSQKLNFDFFTDEMIQISQDMILKVVLASFHGPYKVKYPQRQTQNAVTLHYKVYKVWPKNITFASTPSQVLTIWGNISA